MKIKVEIDDKDFFLFEQKIVELGLDPLDAIELIITKSLNAKDLKASIIKEGKPKNDIELQFIDFENKMRKYDIHQSSIAHLLQTTQASISRALKSKKENTLLYKNINTLHDKLLVRSYVYQYGHDINVTDFNCNLNLTHQSLLFICAFAGLMKNKRDNKITQEAFLFKICELLKTQFFRELDFEKLNYNIEEFTRTINELNNYVILD